ncbi:phosphatidylinositol N-acetylglucosaminyltransferase subunit P-like isoform X3 [Rutidosis leptorrhynchoides]|uniref:phosphatidylinositol N-acetylglucosaminyltransferase subunit P-like isoform X3 n=1 Tax=Rutidosis leptorrhynchoides TaxID=125765 RepID=UPI003A99DF1A
MEDQRSFNSPRRTLSYSRNRGATFSVFETDNKAASGVGVSGEHGPNPSEVYGFVGAISTVVATVWAYVPDPWLHSIGIFYYPSKYWALALPAYASVALATMFLFYVGLNFMATPAPTSLNSIYDENSKDPVWFDPALKEDDRPIEPYSDIGIDQINELMFKDWK